MGTYRSCRKRPQSGALCKKTNAKNVGVLKFMPMQLWAYVSGAGRWEANYNLGKKYKIYWIEKKSSLA